MHHTLWFKGDLQIATSFLHINNDHPIKIISAQNPNFLLRAFNKRKTVDMLLSPWCTFWLAAKVFAFFCFFLSKFLNIVQHSSSVVVLYDAFIFIWLSAFFSENVWMKESKTLVKSVLHKQINASWNYVNMICVVANDVVQ